MAGGIAKLDDGAGQLKAGSAELATKLAEGARQVPNWTTQQKEAVADTIGGPVQLEASHENAAPNFGTGMAPFFLTLALFFGALVLWMVLRPLQYRAIAAEVIAIRVVLASYLPPLRSRCSRPSFSTVWSGSPSACTPSTRWRCWGSWC